MADSIRMPRPIFDEDDRVKKERCETLLMGTGVAGIVLRVFKDRMVIDGYYESEIVEGKTHSNLRKPIVMTWEQLEKAKQRATLPKKVVKALEPDYEDEPSKEYLASLPIVTINNNKYYIDGERKERRPVSNPGRVFVYFRKK